MNVFVDSRVDQPVGFENSYGHRISRGATLILGAALHDGATGGQSPPVLRMDLAYPTSGKLHGGP